MQRENSSLIDDFNWEDEKTNMPVLNEELERAQFDLVKSPSFDEMYFYAGDLGAIYRPNQTVLKVWAPTAVSVSVLLFAHPYHKESERISMRREEKGLYSVNLLGDWAGTAYLFELTFPNGKVVQTVDPYAKAVTVNGEKGVILDPATTDPEGWGSRMAPFTRATDAVIYELHVRDFTIDATSGVEHRGKFLGVIETGRTTPAGQPTALDYLKQLGVTHVQILPMFDFATVDETDPTTSYNWGYDPLNYNVPEGSYATDPYDPACRIREMKQMIQGLHDAGIRVIMDVVYNHVYDATTHALQNTVPDYFFRHYGFAQPSNGTGCGNDTASERLMMRKYILDSVTYWAKEFQLDGFRFDLMGLHDVETMNAVRRALDEIDPSILLIGEGWWLDTALPDDQKANQKNAACMPRIGHFNDSLRTALKGSDFDEGRDTGFVSGKGMQDEWVAINMQGGVNFPQDISSYREPDQMVQYVEAHDNYTLYDKLIQSLAEEEEDTRQRRQLLATAIVLLSQGIAFLHAGQEFFRTKQGVENSFNAPDDINHFDWLRRDRYRDAVAYIEGLIRLRKEEPLFRLPSAEAISGRLSVLKAGYFLIQLQLEGDEKRCQVLINAQNNEADFEVEAGDWEVLAEDVRSFVTEPVIRKVEGPVTVPPLSVTILRKQK